MFLSDTGFVERNSMFLRVFETTPPAGTGWTDIACTADATCALKGPNEPVTCWGSDSAGIPILNGVTF